MRKLTFITLLVLLAAIATAQTVSAPSAAATAHKAVFSAPLTWRADNAGLYKFSGNVSLDKAGMLKDGSVGTDSSEGICEVSSPYTTDGTITNITANWTFTGQVTMEVSATGKASDYKSVICGVPLDLTASTQTGSKLKWRATLEPNSSLSEARITYKDTSGATGDFGNPDLSGFAARKMVFVKGSPEKSLYNFQIRINVGESKKVSGADVYLDSPSKSDLADIRFTQADGETSLPYYLESVTGAKPNRLAAFWVRIPEVPKDAGLPIYIYYSASKAADLSNPGKVFDFFDDFNITKIDPAKWQIYLENKTSAAAIAGSMLELDMARVTSANCNFASGIIEYRAKVSAGGAAGGIIVAGATPDDDLMASASITPNAAHCIMQGPKIISNDPKPIEPDIFYDYRITLDTSSITFQRYADGWGGLPQAETKCSLSNLTPSPIGLSSGKGGTGFYCDWIRIRKGTATPPLIDVNKTASSPEESVDLPSFINLALGPDGSVILAQGDKEGVYISRLIRSPFQARVLTANWTDEAIPVSISTNDDNKFTTGWENGVAKYVSKKEFTIGNKLRWKASFRGQGSGDRVQGLSENAVLKKMSLAFEPGSINIVVPGGGEVIKPADQYAILWNATGYDPAYNMSLSYSTDGGANFQPIASKVPNSGLYMWSVPQADSNQVMVKVADPTDSSIYGVSANYFTVSQNPENLPAQGTTPAAVTGQETTQPETTPATQPEAAQTTQAPAQLGQAVSYTPPPGAKLYELLVKRVDPKEAAKNQNPRSSQDGDIIVIRPAGFGWGNETKVYLIVQAYLTDQEAENLVQPAMITKGTDRNGGAIQELTKKRRYKIDLSKKEMTDRGVAGKTGYLTGGSVSRKVIVDKGE